MLRPRSVQTCLQITGRTTAWNQPVEILALRIPALQILVLPIQPQQILAQPIRVRRIPQLRQAFSLVRALVFAVETGEFGPGVLFIDTEHLSDWFARFPVTAILIARVVSFVISARGEKSVDVESTFKDRKLAYLY